MGNSIKFDEKAWRAQEDARVLARAAEIQKDSNRLKAAQKEAKTQYDAAMKEATNLKNIMGNGGKASTKKK